MEQLFRRLFGRYGVEMTISDDGGSQRVSGVFFSVNSRSWQNMERAFVSLGEIPRGQYICILPASVTVAAGNTVGMDGKQYEIRRAEIVRAGAVPVYYWCLCVEKGGEDLW